MFALGMAIRLAFTVPLIGILLLIGGIISCGMCVALIVLPILYSDCPYITGLTKVVKPFLKPWFNYLWKLPQPLIEGFVVILLRLLDRLYGNVDQKDDEQHPDIASRALHWLAETSKDPQSVNIARQAIPRVDPSP